MPGAAFAEPHPAAAAAAFLGASIACAGVFGAVDFGAGVGVQLVSSSSDKEDEEENVVSAAFSNWGAGGAEAALGAEVVTNFDAAAVLSLSGTAGPFGVSGAFLADLDASRQRSRSFTISRPLW